MTKLIKVYEEITTAHDDNPQPVVLVFKKAFVNDKEKYPVLFQASLSSGIGFLVQTFS